MDIQTINQLVTQDAINNNIQNEYTDWQLIQQFQNEIRTHYVTDPQLISNSIRFRLAQNINANRLPDFTPNTLSENPTLISFVQGILENFYGNTSIEINFSFSLLLTSNGYQRYLYASNNYLALQVAYTIHNDQTRSAFLNRLRHFNVNNYINTAAQALSLKYDEVSLLPLALNIYVRRLPNIVYGKLNQNGLSRCCSKKKQSDKNNECFFNSISAYFDLQDNCLIKLRKPKRRPNRKVARKLKEQFKFFIKFQKKISFRKVFDSDGITDKGITEFEQFFGLHIDIWSRDFTNLTKIKSERIVRCEKLQEYHIRTRKSQNKEKHVINLLSVPSDNCKTRHLLNISNPNFFSKKHYCVTCNIRFNKPWRLARHLGTSAHNTARLVPNSRISQLRQKDVLLSEFLSGQQPTLDHAFSYMIIHLNKDQYFELNFYFKSKNFGSFSTSFIDPTLQNCAKFVISLVPKIGLPHLTSNLAQNCLLFSKLDSEARRLDDHINHDDTDPKISAKGKSSRDM